LVQVGGGLTRPSVLLVKFQFKIRQTTKPNMSGFWQLCFISAAWLFGSAVVPPALADSDTLLQAVGFALTGSDNAKVQPIDRANCVFRVDSDVIRAGVNSSEFAVFHLNNVQADRIAIQNWIRRNYIYGEEKYVTVELHGNARVYEATLPPAVEEKSDDPEAVRTFISKLKREHPESFQTRHISSNEQTLELATNDGDRVNRAWQYIFSHGCVGQKSPF
jgi:hypothetical protein